MTETATTERKAPHRTTRRPRTPFAVSMSALAQHLDVGRSFVAKMVDDGVLRRQADGLMPLDESRIAYIRFLRRERKLTPAHQANAEHQAAKAALLRLKAAQLQKQLVAQSDVDALIHEMVGVTLTALSSMPARCAPHGDLAIRRCIERVVLEVRTEIARICQQKADAAGEPPLDQQT